MSIIYRLAMVSDMDQVVGVEESAFDDGGYSPTTLRQYLDLFPDLFWVAVESTTSTVVGYGVGGITTKNEGWGLSIGIKKGYQGRKIGDRLLREILKTFGEHGVSVVRTTVKPTNHHSLRLCERNGFRTERQDQRYFSSESGARLVLVKTISAGPKAPRFGELLQSFLLFGLTHFIDFVSRLTLQYHVSNRTTSRRSFITADCYYCGWILISLSILFLFPKDLWFVPAYRVLELMFHFLHILFVRPYLPRMRFTADFSRAVLFIGLSIAEILIAFSVFYIASGGVCSTYDPMRILTEPLDALYFSVVTMTTLGYGDFRPEGLARGIVVLHLVTELILFAMLLPLAARLIKDSQLR